MYSNVSVCKKNPDTDRHDLAVNYLDILKYALWNFDTLHFLNFLSLFWIFQ